MTAVILLMFLLNLCAGAIIMVPLRTGLIQFSGESLMADRLITQVDPSFFFEFLIYNPSVTRTLISMIGMVGILYLVAGLFFSAGAFSILQGQESGFWGGGARFFGPFVRILLWTIPVAIVLGLGAAAVLGAKRLLLGSDPLQSWAVWGNLAVAMVLLFLLGILILIIDYARASAVQTGDRRARRAVAQAVRTVWNHPVVTLGFLATCTLLGILSLGLYYLLTSLFSGFLSLGIVIPLALQQTLLLGRTALRLVRYAGTVHLSHQLAPALPRQGPPHPNTGQLVMHDSRPGRSDEPLSEGESPPSREQALASEDPPTLD